MTDTNSIFKKYKYFLPLVIFYMTVTYLTVVLIYKIVNLGGIYASASTFIIPLWYTLTDLMTEVYGYKVSRLLIWSFLICEFIFIFTIVLFIHIPSPHFSHTGAAYLTIYGNLPRVFFGSVTAVLLGSFINIYCISKWKIILHGKHFFFRSIASSAIGEAVFTFFVFTIEFIGTTKLNHVFELMLTSYVIKVLFLPIAAIPIALIARFLKNKENIDSYDYHTNFNPFALSNTSDKNN